jgi:hypothetical protein
MTRFYNSSYLIQNRNTFALYCSLEMFNMIPICLVIYLHANISVSHSSTTPAFHHIFFYVLILLGSQRPYFSNAFAPGSASPTSSCSFRVTGDIKCPRRCRYAVLVVPRTVEAVAQRWLLSSSGTFQALKSTLKSS